ncbi:MAG: CPBP family intramembrane metalloprotease [Eubacteriales bacterium]|nr:CPBP family intramembrane metalloprotease [Eubacteriales bacterium]
MKNLKIKHLIYIIFLGMTISIIGNMAIDFFSLKTIFPINNTFTNSIYKMPMWKGVAIVGIFYPFFEELIFRGIIYKAIRKYINIIFSIIITSLLFAFIHFNIAQGLYAFFASVIFCIIIEKYKSFIIPFVCHLSANITTLLFYRDIEKLLFKDKIFLFTIVLILFILILFRINKKEV